MAQPSLFVFALAFMACSDAKFLGQATGHSNDSKSSDSANSSTPESDAAAIPGATTDDESPLADPPQMVTGAWLTCGVESVSYGDKTTYGCGAYKDGKKIVGSVKDWEMAIENANTDAKIAATIEPSGSESPWHVTFTLPSALDQTYLKIMATATINDILAKNEIYFDAPTLVLAKRSERKVLAAGLVAYLNPADVAARSLPPILLKAGGVGKNFLALGVAIKNFEIRYRKGTTLPAITCDDKDDSVKIHATVIVEDPLVFEYNSSIANADCPSTNCSIRFCAYDANNELWAGDSYTFNIPFPAISLR